MRGWRVGLLTSSGAQAWQHGKDASPRPAPRSHREGPGDVQEGSGEGITGQCVLLGAFWFIIVISPLYDQKMNYSCVFLCDFQWNTLKCIENTAWFDFQILITEGYIDTMYVDDSSCVTINSYNQEMDKNRTTVQERDPFNMSRCPASIDFGQYDIQTWYSAPYPQEYARWVLMTMMEQFMT